MSELANRFREHMELRGFAEKTKKAYDGAMADLARAYATVPPDRITGEQVRAHVARLSSERHLAWTTVNVHVSAYNCFYREVLKRSDEFPLPPRGRARKRPVVLERESVRLILSAHTNLKHRALLARVYGSGLRVSEVCRLRPCHIESAPDRMLVRVEQGKGRKDRYTVLRVTLDREGAVKKVRVTRESGLDFLDQEASRAFMAASPFPNPPKGLQNSEGEVDVPFGFMFEISNRQFRFLPPHM